MNIFDVYFNEVFAGKLSIDKAMRMSFIYDDTYIEKKYPSISLTIPSSKKKHDDNVVFPFIENLLPEGEIRSLIQGQNKIEDGNFARFIELLGGDVAGALSIQLEGDSPKFEDTEEKNELSLTMLSQLLLDIQERPFNVSSQQGAVGNRLSLAGAQNKLPIIYIDNKVYKDNKVFEAKNAPSTHIIKPARKDNRFKSLVYNEYICMMAAKAAGIKTADVSLLGVNDVNGDESDALLIERYDRQIFKDTSTGKIKTQRLQQEDLCQLCSVSSTMKYELSGGPGFTALFSKIKQYSLVPVKDDIEVFKRLIFSLVIGNYDAHAKNFSFLISPLNQNQAQKQGGITLSPAYDLVCTALYKELDTTFAMLIGEANDMASLNEDAFKQLFASIHKKYSTMRKQLIKCADTSLKALTDVVAEFIDGDYYQADIDSAQRILDIAKVNHRVLLNVFNKPTSN